ncbi:hypothetical protein BURMUCGD1_2406 [Burkholderia multivorans CGD1]|nr:hypothetical protein BURMUCGD1_2406 [Burkholderia multivorans CGD1]
MLRFAAARDSPSPRRIDPYCKGSVSASAQIVRAGYCATAAGNEKSAHEGVMPFS